MSAANLRLACRACGWRPDNSLTLGVIEAHVLTEHPEQVKEDGSPRIDMTLVVLCPRCDVKMPRTRSIERTGHRELHYDCPACHRSYMVRQRRDE